MYTVEIYARVRRAVLVEGRSRRAVAREWVSHKEVVPEWMNAAREHPSFSRVSELVSKLRRVQSEIDAYPDEEALLTYDKPGPIPIPDPVQKALGEQVEIVGVLSDYLISHGVEHSLDGKCWSLPLVPNPVPGEFILERRIGLTEGSVSGTNVENGECFVHQVGEGNVVFRIMILAQSGHLHRLRRCRKPGCIKWFYAFKSHKVYCGKPCRVEHNTSSPEMKRKRSDYKHKVLLAEKERHLQMGAATHSNPSTPLTSSWNRGARRL
jgi:hypothetical protein